MMYVPGGRRDAEAAVGVAAGLGDRPFGIAA
jgi:hypothetical protein